MNSRPIPPIGASPAGTLPPGTLLAGRYQIEELVATGGMGAVYRARDRRFRAVVRRCAVKEMFDAIPDPQVRRRAVEHFEREANLLASLNHRAIPKVFDYFTESERHYLVYEFVEGQDLAQVLYQRSRPLPPEKVTDWAIQLTHVLEALHRNEPPIIFRDMKPSNVMLTPPGEIVLVDFGIAKHFQPAHRGTMIGTEGYAPPEQYEGQANPGVDVYALGATMHQLLTNTDPQEYRPFSFDQRPIRQYNPAVSSELDGIVMSALSYNAEERWASMQELRRALETSQGRASGSSTRDSGRPYTPKPTGPVQGNKRSSRKGTGLFEQYMQGRSGGDDTSPIPAPPPPQATPTAPPVQASNPGTVSISDVPPSLPPAMLHKPDHTLDLQKEFEGEAGIVPRWTFATEDEVRSTPALDDDALYIGSYDTNLYCIARQSGDFVWKYATGGGIPGTPTLWKNLVLVGSEDHYLYALSRETGFMEWSSATGGRIRSSPHVAHDHVIVGSDDGQLYAYNAVRGTLMWKYNAGAPVRSTPITDEEMVFVGAEDGSVHGIDLLMGDGRWRIHAGGPVLSSPVLGSERLIFGSMDRQVYGADPHSGWVVWRVRLSDRVYSSPCVRDGRVYICAVDGMVYCLDAEWGKEIWKMSINTSVTSSPVVDEAERLFVGGANGVLHCIDARRGKPLWQFKTGGPIPGSPRTRDGLVYFGSMDHRVYALPTEAAPFTV